MTIQTAKIIPLEQASKEDLINLIKNYRAKCKFYEKIVFGE